MQWGKVVGINVRRLREARGLTQEKLAHDAGINMRYLGTLERRGSNISLDVLGRLAAALKVHPAELFRPVATSARGQVE